MRDPQIEALPCELVTPVRLLIKEARVLHSDTLLTQKNSNACSLQVRTRHSHRYSCGLGSPSRFCCSFLRGLRYVLCSLHHLLAQLFCMVAEHLRLQTNEVGLNLREFLRFPYMDDLASTHERI